MGSASYGVISDVDNYNKSGRMKKQLTDTGMQILMMNQVSAHKNNSIMTLARLQFQGVTENQILNACKLIEVSSHNLNPNSNNSHFE